MARSLLIGAPGSYKQTICHFPGLPFSWQRAIASDVLCALSWVWPWVQDRWKTGAMAAPAESKSTSRAAEDALFRSVTAYATGGIYTDTPGRVQYLHRHPPHGGGRPLEVDTPS